MGRPKYIFSGRARAKLEELYFFWGSEILRLSKNKIKYAEYKFIKDDLEAARKKKYVPDQYFINLFEFLKSIYTEREGFDDPRMRTLEYAIRTWKPSSVSVFGRLFNYKSKDHNFTQNEFDDSQVKKPFPSRNSANFYCYLLTDRDIDDFEEEGFIGDLTFDADIQIIHFDNSEPLKQKSFFNTKLLTTLPPIDFESNIIPRNDDLRRIASAIEDGFNRIQLFGIGGIGKSILALNYAYSSFANWERIIWIEQGQDQDLISAFTTNSQLRESLAVHLLENESNEELFARIMLRLSNLNGSNLLVIDDADEELSTPDISKLLPTVKNWVLITTSRRKIEEFRQLEVDSMLPSEALELFRKHHKKSILAETENKLLEVVEYHPLAVELIARTLMASRRISPTQILAKFKNLLLDDLTAAPTIYKQGREIRIFGYLLETFKAIQSEFDPFGWDLLRQLSVTVPLLTPIDDLIFLFGIPEQSLDKFDEVLNHLHHTGWISVFSKTETYQIHRMVRDMLYYQIQPEVEDLEAMIERLASKIANIDELRLPVDLYKWAPFAEHITLLMRGKTNSNLDNLNHSFISLLGTKGEVARAIKYTEYRIDMLLQEFGENHPKTALARSELGNLHIQNGDFQSAIDQLEIAIENDIHSFGDNSIRVYSYKIDLAVAYIMGGMQWDAKDLLESLKADLIKHLGSDHNLVSLTNLRLSEAYEELGLLREAMQLSKTIVEYDRARYPRFHHQLALSLSQHGLLLNQLGEITNARRVLEEVREIEIKNYGEIHPSVATAHSNLALIAQHEGDLNLALTLYEKALEIDQQFYSGDHPHFIIPLNGKASVLMEMGTWEPVENLYLTALRVAKKYFPSSHPSVLEVQRNLCEYLIEMERIEEAIEMLQTSLDEAIAHYGAQHPLPASYQTQIAFALQHGGFYQEAMQYFEKSLNTITHTYGTANTKTSDAMSNLGLLFLDMGLESEALPLMEKAFEIDNKMLGEEHPDCAASMSNLAMVLERINRNDKAIILYEKALKIAQEKFGESHDNTLSILSNYGGLLGEIGKCNEAVKIFDSTLSAVVETWGEMSTKTLTVRMNFAKTLWQCLMKQRSEVEMFKVLEGRKEVLGIFHPDTFSTMMNIISILLEGDRGDEAESLICEIEEIVLAEREEHYDQTEVSQAFSYLGFYYEDRNPEKSILYRKNAYQLAKEIWGDDDEYTRKLFEMISTNK